MHIFLGDGDGNGRCCCSFLVLFCLFVGKWMMGGVELLSGGGGVLLMSGGSDRGGLSLLCRPP